ncbi:MAG: ACT domain-containing protein [Burkholderiales bacterium]|nr:ACT domain-containing protein [Burkholderiales bacterium]
MPSGTAGNRAIVTVIGEDRVGIIAGVATLLADAQVNILDISQSIMQEFFVMIMMVDLAASRLGFDDLKHALGTKGAQMSLKIDIQREDVFKLMHRV